MNKLGFYIERTTVEFMRAALSEVKPPTILLHAGDRGLLRDIRAGLSPDSFIVGRMFVDGSEQSAWLDSSDPAARGQAYADTILGYDFGFATEYGANGRRLVDAWMGLNEALPGPASFASGQVDDAFKRRAAALDTFQVAFRQRLQTQGVEAVAFNFGAGNYTQPAHYLDWFPKTLASYVYLGFHEYGWPSLTPGAGTQTAALYYRTCMDGIRSRYGSYHRAVITEAGLARMYKYPSDPAGDVGWLYPRDPISEDAYFEALTWYNQELNKDSYVLGACLFNVGHTGTWETFRHLGNDNSGRPLQIISKVATLNTGGGDTTDLEALRARLTTVRTTLTAAASQSDGLQARAEGYRQRLDALAASTTEATILYSQLGTLAARVARVVATVESLANGLNGSVPHIATLREAVADLRTRLAELQAATIRATDLHTRVDETRAALDALSPGVLAAARLHDQVDELLAEVASVAALLGMTSAHAVPRPTILDVSHSLPAHEHERFPERSSSAIKRVILHHTAAPGDAAPQILASAQIERGLPGIPYHFLVAGDGAIYQTQPLEAVTEQTLSAQANAESAGVALGGDFDEAVPTDDQLASAAATVAWLLSTLGLGPDAVFGRCEIDEATTSPGLQWLQGAHYKDRLEFAVWRLLRGGR